MDFKLLGRIFLGIGLCCGLGLWRLFNAISSSNCNVFEENAVYCVSYYFRRKWSQHKVPYEPSRNPKTVQEDHPMYCLDCLDCLVWWRGFQFRPLIPISQIKHSTCLWSSFIIPVQVLDTSSVLPACPTHVPFHLNKNHFISTKAKHRLPIQHHISKGHKILSLFRFVASSFKVFFGGRVMDWGRLDFRELVRQWLRQTFRNGKWLRLLVLHNFFFTFKSHETQIL
jgi:hypothetical protein